MDAPEYLPQSYTDDGKTILVHVSREVAADDLGASRLTAEQFAEWQDANLDRILRSALHKLKHIIKADLLAGPVLLRPGELLP